MCHSCLLLESNTTTHDLLLKLRLTAAAGDVYRGVLEMDGALRV